MKKVFVSVLCVLLLSHCGRGWQTEVSSQDNELALKAPDRANTEIKRREHLFSLPIKGLEQMINWLTRSTIEPLLTARTFLDVGVHESFGSDGTLKCRFLQPNKQESWNPIHLYTNITKEGEWDAQPNRRESADVFFPGDDHNRNNGKSAHTDTLAVRSDIRDSLDFLKADHSSIDTEVSQRISYHVTFTRSTKLVMRELISIFTFPTKKEDGTLACGAGAFLCTEKDEQGKCLNGGWKFQVRELEAHVDTDGAWADWRANVTNGKLKNDILKVIAIVSPAEENGTASSERQSRVLVEKKAE